MRRASVMLVCLPLAAGCARPAPTLDTSSEAAMRASLDRMADGLPEAEAEKLAGAFVVLSLGPAMDEAFSGKGEPSPTHVLMKPYHGLTASELIAKANEEESKPTPDPFAGVQPIDLGD